MQQRQPRLGDILDDYCPRERRVTNHVVVAMVGADVKQTRCSTCDTEHEFKHAKVPRQRRKSETPAALYAQVASGAPKRIAHDPAGDLAPPAAVSVEAAAAPRPTAAPVAPPEKHDLDADQSNRDVPASDADVEEQDDEGPVHRPLIRASLPRQDGQQPPPRPIPEFTIRQPAGRPNRFRPRHQGSAGPRGGGAGQQFQGNRSNGNMPGGPRGMRPGGGRPPHGAHGAAPTRLARRNGPGRKRSK
jgi:hypothetical protein